MVYRHQTLKLKEPLPKAELQKHLSILTAAFPSYKATSYHMPDDVTWQRTVRRYTYQIYPVENGFGIAVDIGEKPQNRDNIRICTLYPSLRFAVLDSPFGYRSKQRKDHFMRKLDMLGYTLSEQDSQVTSSSFGVSSVRKEQRPFYLTVEQQGLFHTDKVFQQVLANVQAIVSGRVESELYEAVVFSPPGDGGGNSPIGLTKRARDYGIPRLNIGECKGLSICNGFVDSEELYQLYKELKPLEALGVSSHRLPLRVSRDAFFQKRLAEYSPRSELLESDLHSCMIDFKCSTPEEAVHTAERLGISLTSSKAILLDSGNSFHMHFPSQLRTKEQSLAFLDDLVRHEDVCEKWIPLQKQQGYQLLRVSPCIQKPQVPVVLPL